MASPRKQKILDAAREEFARFGYAGGRVARIAARAGVNKQLLFYYFGSKAGLFQAVAQEASDLPSTVPADAPATEQLRRALAEIFATLESRPALVASLVQPPDAAADPASARMVLRDLEDRLADVISTGQGLGYFRDDADPAVVARMGVVLAAGFLALEPRLPDHPDHATWVRAAGESLVRTLAW